MSLVPVETAPHRLGSGYWLERPIGSGTTGSVWRGQRFADGAPVAVKVLWPQHAGHPDAVARFLRERTALRGLRHPHLVSVHDLVVEGDTLAVVMDLVDGWDLRDAMRGGEVIGDEMLIVLSQVARALAYVHDAGLVHRDVKPENILISRRDGEPWARVADFGLLWEAGARALTNPGQTLGTPAYLAPELFTDRPYGPPVDIYALGVTAYELVGGRRPFAAVNPLALMRAHLDDKPGVPPAFRVRCGQSSRHAWRSGPKTARAPRSWPRACWTSPWTRKVKRCRSAEGGTRTGRRRHPSTPAATAGSSACCPSSGQCRCSRPAL